MRAYVTFLKPLLYSHIAAFHAISPNESATIRRVFPSKKVYVVPNGLAPRFTMKRGRSRTDVAEADSVRLVCVGRLDVQTKGLDVLLAAFAHATRRCHRPLELTLIGPAWGTDLLRVERMIDQLGISDVVSLPGKMGQDGVAEALRTGHVFVQMSRWDAFSLAALEAMAMELPCVLSSRVGIVSFPSIAALPHVNLTEPSIDEATATIEAVVGSLERQREDAHRAGPSIREQFSWEGIAEEHERAYRRLGIA